MSVENRNFKISKESSFYSRNKSIAKSRMIENNSDRCFIDCDYEILKSSVTLTVGGILLTLKRVSDTESCLSGEILMFTDGSLHVFFDEINPIYPRFRVDLETSLTRVQSCTIRSEENEVI